MFVDRSLGAVCALWNFLEDLRRDAFDFAALMLRTDLVCRKAFGCLMPSGFLDELFAVRCCIFRPFLTVGFSIAQIRYPLASADNGSTELTQPIS